MAFAGVSVIDDGKLCASTASPVDAGYDDSGYHLLVVQGYTRTTKDTPTGEYVESRPFKVGGVRFLLRCYPNGRNEDAKEFISVTLDFGEQDPGVVHLFPVSVRCAKSLIDQTAQQVSSEIKRGDETYISTECLYEDVVRRDVLERSRHLKNDSFTIRHFSNLLLTKKGSDITFEVGGKMIAAHRCVLGARSSVFMEQFFGAGVMNEGATATSVVKIDGIKETVFRGLLTYVYTDALPYIRSDKMEEDEGEKQERNGKGQVEAGEEEGETDEEETDEEEREENR
ncbi:LOW QUALITY PROTEIN: BTB/POZ and MATH domain-containing protein 6 [Brachypodium distachyon]|uniref:LOW QUALITY PROTEIN: BTB/POZ and MATH domain-containing protein 6 n=1 Tax=Brachypodium distachyon TaxID=15368 RepID=UPI000D0CDC5A|nr:LOW QUALITY PROTEIN: BTB/POZ and MATH domain-containing protein 6 [Brachypodium distachyon]|eukprot:XP_024318341.1 LOW QUALITY PROTEIN: BTB/POZ and MATH domain-containing protein 6 [Brachypodium distachyon]